jgi:hypothetical protein
MNNTVTCNLALHNFEEKSWGGSAKPWAAAWPRVTAGLSTRLHSVSASLKMTICGEPSISLMMTNSKVDAEAKEMDAPSARR